MRRKKSKTPIKQYKHKSKKRKNNPPIGLVNKTTDPIKKKKKIYQYDPHLSPELNFNFKEFEIENIIDQGLSGNEKDAKSALRKLKKRKEPYLNWAGKAERTSFEVPTVSLHVHERIDSRAIIESVRKTNLVNYEQLSLFNQKTRLNENDVKKSIEFYQHEKDWSNRLISGDSLLVMNSLLEKENMYRKVQCIYIDPPYGIKYGSNFQPFVNKRDVKDGKDEDLTSEPEMIRAFRDTWELGIHSWLTYLRDRLLLAREMLHESGSCFVQISDENVHLVRNLMDEVFGRENFVSQIVFRKKQMPLGSKTLESSSDFIIWFSKSKKEMKYRCFYKNKNIEGNSVWNWVESEDGKRRQMTKEEINNHNLLEKNSKVFQNKFLEESKNAVDRFNYKVKFGNKFFSPKRGGWVTHEEGMKRLLKANRIIQRGNSLGYVLYHEDYPVTSIMNVWNEMGSPTGMIFVVQTNKLVIQRCILMTTDPGDLVFDPTCGSGTTAYVAEQWGRRWITCDTSRVAVALAKQRLMTAHFKYYKLKYPEEGIASGFNYKKVQHTTLGSIANNESSKKEVLIDQPDIDEGKSRVTGPFTVEAVPSATQVQPIDRKTVNNFSSDLFNQRIDNRADWIRAAEESGIRGKKGVSPDIHFTRLEAVSGSKWIHAEGETKDPNPKKVLISFGPTHAPMDQRQVELVLEEVDHFKEKSRYFKNHLLIFASFQFDSEASKNIDEMEIKSSKQKNKIRILKIQMDGELLVSDLKKRCSENKSFWLIGQPDIDINFSKSGKVKIKVKGWDYYNAKEGKIKSGGKENIAMWLLDTDYDGKAVFPKQVFFPLSGNKEGWSKLAKSLKSEINENLIEKYRGTECIPFKIGKEKKAAVKIIDDRGIESLRIIDLSETQKKKAA